MEVASSWSGIWEITYQSQSWSAIWEIIGEIQLSNHPPAKGSQHPTFLPTPPPSHPSTQPPSQHPVDLSVINRKDAVPPNMANGLSTHDAMEEAFTYGLGVVTPEAMKAASLR